MYSAHRSRGSSRGRRAFSFLEIMLVVAIIGIMAALIAPRLAGKARKAQETATRSQLDSIKTALGLFEVKTGDYPTSEQGLEALVKRPTEISEDVWDKCMDEVPRDAWGQEFVYQYPGEHGGDYDLYSFGADKQEGTDDDITNFPKGD